MKQYRKWVSRAWPLTLEAVVYYKISGASNCWAGTSPAETVQYVQMSRDHVTTRFSYYSWPTEHYRALLWRSRSSVYVYYRSFKPRKNCALPYLSYTDTVVLSARTHRRFLPSMEYVRIRRMAGMRGMRSRMAARTEGGGFGKQVSISSAKNKWIQ